MDDIERTLVVANRRLARLLDRDDLPAELIDLAMAVYFLKEALAEEHVLRLRLETALSVSHGRR